jgi:hypothetical protein
MTDDQENRLSAAIATSAILTVNAALYAAIPAMITKATEQGTKIAEIQGTAQVQEQDRTGIALDKADAKEATARAAETVIGPIEAFAIATSNNTLQEKVNYSLSTLIATRDTEFPNLIQIIIDEANANLATYTPYGLTAGMVTSLTTLLASYVILETAPRQGISVQAAATAMLKTKFSELLTIQETLDALMKQFESSQPDFFNQYTTARKKVDTGSQSSSNNNDGPPPPTP